MSVRSVDRRFAGMGEGPSGDIGRLPWDQPPAPTPEAVERVEIYSSEAADELRAFLRAEGSEKAIALADQMEIEQRAGAGLGFDESAFYQEEVSEDRDTSRAAQFAKTPWPWSRDQRIEDEFLAGPQDQTAAPVFSTQVGEDAGPVLLDKPGAEAFLGTDEGVEEVPPVAEEVITEDDYVKPTQIGGDAGEGQGLWDVPPAEADAPITPEMIEQGPWQKTQMGFFAKDYRPSDLELDAEGQPITRPAGFFGDPVPPAPVVPPTWINPDVESELIADVEKDDELTDAEYWARAEASAKAANDARAAAAVEETVIDDIDDDEVAVEVEDEEVSGDDPRGMAIAEALTSLSYLVQELEKDAEAKRNIIRIAGQELYDKIAFGNYRLEDIAQFYRKLSEFQDRIEKGDEEKGTNYWNIIESIHRILVLGELG